MTQTYDLNLIPGKVPTTVHVKQYDTALRQIVFNLYAGDVLFSLPSSGAVVTVSGTKPDGNGFSYNVTTFSGSTVTVPMKEQMTVLAGDMPCQLTVSNSTGVLGTATFILAVAPAALSDDTPVSETDLALFQQLATQTQQEAAKVAGAAEQISTNTAAISSLNSKFSSIQVRTIAINYDIAASGTYPGSMSWNLKTLIDSDMPDGYRCLGTSGYTTNNVQVVVIACRYYDNGYSLQIRNLSNSAQTGSVLVQYLCAE